MEMLINFLRLDYRPGTFIRSFFYKEQSNVTLEEFLTTKIVLWIDMWSSIDNTLHCSIREVNKGILLQIEKGTEASGGDLTCHVFNLEDETARLNVTNPSGILTIEQRDI